MTTFTCISCGVAKPVEEAHETGDNLATLCEQCYRRGLQVRFTAICPSEYQATDTGSPMFPGVAKKRLPQVLDWKYGPKGLVLWGRESGLGKSRCMWLLIQRIMCMDGFDVIAFDSIGFAEELERRYHNEEDVRGWLDEVTDAPVVAFDDFAKFKATERVSAEMYALIDRRVHRGLPILATMNESGADLEAGSRDKRMPYLVRRLREFSECLEF